MGNANCQKRPQEETAVFIGDDDGESQEQSVSSSKRRFVVEALEPSSYMGRMRSAHTAIPDIVGFRQKAGLDLPTDDLRLVKVESPRVLGLSAKQCPGRCCCNKKPVQSVPIVVLMDGDFQSPRESSRAAVLAEDKTAKEETSKDPSKLRLFFDAPFHSVDTEKFRLELLVSFMGLGMSQESVRLLEVSLHPGSIIAEVRGPATAIQELSSKPLSTIRVMGYPSKTATEMQRLHPCIDLSDGSPAAEEASLAEPEPVPAQYPCHKEVLLDWDIGFEGEPAELVARLQATHAEASWRKPGLIIPEADRRELQRVNVIVKEDDSCDALFNTLLTARMNEVGPTLQTRVPPLMRSHCPSQVARCCSVHDAGTGAGLGEDPGPVALLMEQPLEGLENSIQAVGPSVPDPFLPQGFGNAQQDSMLGKEDIKQTVIPRQGDVTEKSHVSKATDDHEMPSAVEEVQQVKESVQEPEPEKEGAEPKPLLGIYAAQSKSARTPKATPSSRRASAKVKGDGGSVMSMSSVATSNVGHLLGGVLDKQHSKSRRSLDTAGSAGTTGNKRADARSKTPGAEGAAKRNEDDAAGTAAPPKHASKAHATAAADPQKLASKSSGSKQSGGGEKEERVKKPRGAPKEDDDLASTVSATSNVANLLGPYAKIGTPKRKAMGR